MQNNKQTRYQNLLPQIQALIASEPDLPIATLANVCAILKENFAWLWVGFYLVNQEQTELQLGPFQGPIACARIAKGRGVCGQSWQENRSIIVPNVHQHPDHIACSSRAQSEIVLPLYNVHHHIIGVLDIDSEDLNTFDTIDEQYLRQILDNISQHLYNT